ncbi:MAG: hypothetical protein ACYCU7_06370 [Acidimicrobiales bacterium]
MAGEPECPHDDDELDALRRWAWARGRTDVVKDLDLHASAWSFLEEPDRSRLLRLAAVLPTGDAGRQVEGRVLRLVEGVAPTAEMHRLRADLVDWCQRLCGRIAADLGEMRTV